MIDQIVPLEVLEAVPFDYVMWGVLGVTLIVFGVYSAVLFWHWKMYSTGKYTTMSNMTLYLTVSGLFIALMVFSAIAYTVV